MRTDFLSNVSHELKTPIALIQGYAEGLKEGITDDPESMEFYCDVIMDEANKMNTMVKRLLTLNQIEFGNDEPEMERFDINELIASVVDANAIRAGQKNMSIVFDNRNEHNFVWADEYKTEEVLTNYISNALNHCDGKRAIEVRTENQRMEELLPLLYIIVERILLMKILKEYGRSSTRLIRQEQENMVVMVSDCQLSRLLWIQWDRSMASEMYLMV